jgi:hypothetical protein
MGVQRLGVGRMRAAARAVVTNATAVTRTVRTYERRDALCRAGAIRRLIASIPESVPE